MIGVTMDVTQQKIADQRLATEHAVGRVLSDSPSLLAAAPRILEAVCLTIGWQLAALWTVDRQGHCLRCVEVWQRPDPNLSDFRQKSHEITFGPGVGLPGRVWSSGEPAWIEDVTVDSNFPRKAVAAKVGLHGAVAFPILLTKEVLGVMEFFSQDVRRPDKALLAMMQSIGTQVGQFIDRRRAEQDLRDSEARTAAILETALDCIISMNHEGKSNRVESRRRKDLRIYSGRSGRAGDG